jgi:hypothetical protein
MSKDCWWMLVDVGGEKMPSFWTIEVSLGRSVGWLTNYHDPPKDKLSGCEFKGRPPGPLTQIYQQYLLCICN